MAEEEPPRAETPSPRHPPRRRSFFFTITIPRRRPARIRFKLPQVLSDTMDRRKRTNTSNEEDGDHHHNEEETKDHKPPSRNRRILNKLGSMLFSNALANKLRRGHGGDKAEGDREEREEEGCENGGGGDDGWGGKHGRVVVMSRSSSRQLGGRGSRRRGGGGGGGVELCKRRILMGGKCRPLSGSHGLHYGKDGVLLADGIGS
ncbi:unnamed protein product [Linum trigynum]|uniref:Uncharacterized protein n=1 Tax=Linum trigynum TaxID=586398 RepID=A0AAV2F5S6_9ROSI